MLIIIWIITSIIVFSIIILVHEYGHFKTARIFGVKVEEFWLWIPPKARTLWKDKYWTAYTLNWLPLGGFVRLKWESIHTFHVYDTNKKLYNNQDLEKDLKNNVDIFDVDGKTIPKEIKQEIYKKLQDNFAKDSLLSKPAWQQAIIMLAWVCMNFILAIFIFSIIFFIWVSPIGINYKIATSLDLKLIPTPEKAKEIGLIIENPWVYLLPAPDSIALKSWIKNYDLALKANWIEIKNYEELKNIIWENKENNIVLEIKRSLNNCDITKSENCDFENIFVSVTPSNEWKIGSYLIPNTQINKDFTYHFSFIESLQYWTLETYGQIILTFKWLSLLAGKIFDPETPSERQEAIEQISWPIGMVDFMTKSISNGIVFILILWAIISINLWVFNLLPIPALDGGRFLLITINSIIKKIFGKKAISENLEGLLHVGFFILLIALSIIIAYNDIAKIIN